MFASDPSNPARFPGESIYANMDYLFWRKDTIEPRMDKDPYPWIIWYIWKARNDKLFRRIERDARELVRYAENECQAWFDANDTLPTTIQNQNSPEDHVISLGSICMIDGSWTTDSRFSGSGWAWKDSLGRIQLMGTKNCFRYESALQSEVEALKWAMENMLQHSTCQSFGTDCKDLIAMIKEPHSWPRFATELETIATLKICFPDFMITYVPHKDNQISNFLAKTARSFHRELCFIGCSILVWLPRPPQD